MKNVLNGLRTIHDQKTIDELTLAYRSEHGEDDIDTSEWENKFVFFSKIISFVIVCKADIGVSTSFGFFKELFW